jgi:translation initiation factor eIF-2B subunit beta
MAAQPKEMVVGNIVRRVLGLVREVAEDEAEPNMSEVGLEKSPLSQDSQQRPELLSHISTFSPLKHGVAHPAETALGPGENVDIVSDPLSRPFTSHPSYTQPSALTATSLFGLFSHPEPASGTSTPPNLAAPIIKSALTSQNFSKLDGTISNKDIKAEVLEGIREILDELDQVDDQIAGFALDHIHDDEVILTHTSSLTVQKFLLHAARKRKFTVVFVEGYPNDSDETHSTLLLGRTKHIDPEEDEEESRWKTLTSLGITVVMIPDSAVYAVLSRVNKVILSVHTVLANGGLVAAAGAKIIATAAKMHQTPVIVLSGVYKLSPIYPFDVEELIEYGDASRVIPPQESDTDWSKRVEVMNPLYDYVPADLVGLYITNLGGHAPSYLYRIVADHYNTEDITL